MFKLFKLKGLVAEAQLEVLNEELKYVKLMQVEYKKYMDSYMGKVWENNERAFVINERLEAILPRLEQLAAPKKK